MDARRGREIEEEMQRVLHFLDMSMITPPSGSDLVTQPPQQQGEGYSELGEVIDLLGSLDANDTDPHLQRQQQETGFSTGLNPTETPRTGESVPQRVQLPRSTAVNGHNGGDNISPVGFLSGPSMSPATINWLQTLVPSTSTESLTGLISPATLYGGGAIGGVAAASSDGAKSGGLQRTPSCEIIDWKAYNESRVDKTQKEPAKWRVIPQHGPHADPVPSSSGSNPPTAKLPPGGASGSTASELTTQQQIHLAARKMADEKNKRKALVSPEYVQYANPVSTTASAAPREPSGGVKKDPAPAQYATKVPEPTGRRPFKKSLHQTTNSADKTTILKPQRDSKGPTPSTASSTDGNDDDVRCKCTGKCRNARCACVKAGLVCGAQCKCVSCANPFVPMTREGIDIQLMVADVCLMQFLSKIKDMQELLDSTVGYECCGGGGAVQVKHTVENGFACPHCGAHFTYSWCNNRLCSDAKKPRRHCEKCRRCGDHRNQHCDRCNHCYFAGVANSFRCSCRGGSSAKTRAVVPNPVRRDAETATKPGGDEDKKTGSQRFDVINLPVDRTARDENADTNNSSKEEVDDSCKMQ